MSKRIFDKPRSSPYPWRFATAVVIGCWQIVMFGCGQAGPEIPDTYPVTGKVLKADGQPMTNAIIDFRPEGNAVGMTSGELQSDGSFELVTMVDGEKVPGAIAGPHQVSVTPLMGDQTQQTAVVGPIFLPTPFVVKAGDNDFTIQLD